MKFNVMTNGRQATVPLCLLLACFTATIANGRRVITSYEGQESALGHAQHGHGHLRAEFEDREHKDNKEKNNPLGEVIFGLLLWSIVPAFLWNNERIAIKQYKMQFKAERWAIHVDENTREPIKEMDGHIVYLSGTSTCEETLTDSEFKSVKSVGKIKLRRCVAMFQWVEHESEEGEGDNKRTVYSWTQEWRDTRQSCPHGDSDKQNPSMPITSTTRQNAYRAGLGSGFGDECAVAAHENVKLGAYYLGDYIIRELQEWKDKEDVTADMVKLGGMFGKDRMKGEPSQDKEDGYWYYDGDRSSIGAMRVKFEELNTGPISIVGVLTHTEKGWTFVPVKRPDAAGAGDNAAAEICGSCCIRVKELHYDEEDEDKDKEFKEDLSGRPAELTSKEKKAFQKAKTSANVEEYAIEDNMDDLCCVGPLGPVVIKVMHWFGLEEEFLAVREKNMPLDKIMNAEGGEAANRHHIARVVGFVLLVLGAFAIISPIIKILNYNWLTTLLGGGLISAVLCCCACLCSTSCFCIIVSTAWIAHRPFLATFGLTCAGLIGFGAYYYIHMEEQKAAAGQVAFTAMHSTVTNAMHHFFR